MTDIPDGIVLERNRDLEHIRRRPWPRWVILTLVTAVSVLGLLNAFGQRPGTARASSSEASMALYAPDHLRGGLLFTARFHVTAQQDVKNAILILDPGWAEGMSINTVEPSPLGEGSSNGRLTLQLGHIAKGQSYLLWMEFQVNPTNIAWRRPANVTLADGSKPLLQIRHHFTIYP